MITSYFEFFHKIFEANELELAESFIVKLYKARMLASEKVKAKAKKLEEEPNISDADLKKYLNKDVKLTSEQEKEAKDIALTDPYYNRIKNITKDKPEWFPQFLQFFFLHFKNSKPEAQRDYDLISSLIGDYSINAVANYDNVKVENLDFGALTESENLRTISKTFNEMLKLKPNVLKKVLGRLPFINKLQNIQKQDINRMSDDEIIQLTKDIFPEYLDVENENFKSSLSSEPSSEEIENKLKEGVRIVKELIKRPGHEALDDFIRDTQKKSDIDFLISRLPRGIKDPNNPRNNRPDLLEEFNKLRLKDKLNPESEYTKEDLINLLGDLVDLLYKKGIKLEVTSGKSFSDRYPYEIIFKMRAGSSEDKQEDKSLEDFRDRLSKSLNTSSNSNVAYLDDMVKKANEKYGENSAVVVWRNQVEPKVILNIKNHKANVFLHGKRGELKQTPLCIAWEDDSNWKKYIGDKNELYFVYNFLLPSESIFLPFGVAIAPNGKVSSAFDRLDQNGEGLFNVSMTQAQVEKHMRNFGMPYDELKPLSAEEISKREFSKNATNAFVTPGITVEYLKRCLESGVDPNYRNGQAMINALNEDNMEKVKILIEAGARVDNLGQSRASSINYAKSLEALIKLMNAGVKLRKKEETYINNIITDDILKPNFTTNIYTLLELIPKYSVTKSDLSLIPANDIYERMLDLTYQLKNLPLFKVIVDATKKRLLEDFDEPDFLVEFINRGIVKAAKYKEILINTIRSVYADDPEYVEELIDKVNKIK